MPPSISTSISNSTHSNAEAKLLLKDNNELPSSDISTDSDSKDDNDDDTKEYHKKLKDEDIDENVLSDKGTKTTSNS